ncbi:MAG: LytTR family DNA-binding domain-containing protein [Bacteroidota bacterium]
MLRSIIIEDEPLAASLLEKYSTQYAGLENLAIFRNAVDASTFLESNDVDILFLDLHLPKIRGFEFLDGLQKRYHVILTTAYSEYALKGFEKGVFDYLVKPILYPRFELAMNRLKEILPSNTEQTKAITIQVNKSKIRIPEEDILFIESNRGYVNIHDANGLIYRTKMSTTGILQLLSGDFLRIHKSYVINSKKIRSLSSSEIVLCHTAPLPIGRKYKQEILTALSKEF